MTSIPVSPTSDNTPNKPHYILSRVEGVVCAFVYPQQSIEQARYFYDGCHRYRVSELVDHHYDSDTITRILATAIVPESQLIAALTMPFADFYTLAQQRADASEGGPE